MIMSEINLSCRQHFWIVFCNNIIQSVNQLWFPERDVRGALLKVFNSEHFIFIALFTLNRPDVLIQMNSDVFPVVGDRFTAEQMQHSFQVGKSVCLLPGDKMKSPQVHLTRLLTIILLPNLQGELVL